MASRGSVNGEKEEALDETGGLLLGKQIADQEQVVPGQLELFYG